MASFDGQTTDDENSRAPLKVTKPGDDVKTVSSQSAQAIARQDYKTDETIGPGTPADIIAPEQS